MIFIIWVDVDSKSGEAFPLFLFSPWMTKKVQSLKVNVRPNPVGDN